MVERVFSRMCTLLFNNNIYILGNFAHNIKCKHTCKQYKLIERNSELSGLHDNNIDY